MKTIHVAAAVAGALSLAACSDEGVEESAVYGSADDAASGSASIAADADTGVTDGTAPGDSISISEDGVKADVDNGDTRIQADVGNNPSMTVTKQ